MSESTVYGKSYWELVIHSFRKNWGARLALWISGALLILAVFTPLIANDRPFCFKGTLPSSYRKACLALRGPAVLAILNSSNGLKREGDKFETKTASQADLMKRASLPEAQAIYPIVERLRKNAEQVPEIRARWISMDITIAEMDAEMTPEERAIIDPIRRRIITDLPALHRDLMPAKIEALRLKIRQIADQLGPDRRTQVMEFERRVVELCQGDLLTEAEARRPRFNELTKDMREAFDPDNVQLVAKWRWPVIDSLDILDLFFMTGAFLAMLAFGPMTWLWLKRIQPIERRWGRTWLIILVPAVLLAGAWGLWHEETFDNVNYTEVVAEGETPTIVIQSAVWPIIRHRYDEQPTDPNTRLNPPSAKHPLGTDFLGRDLLTRMMWGSRVSLSIGFVSAGIAAIIGIFLGANAGFYRGWVDMVLSRIIEIMLCFPVFFLILAVIAFLPPNLFYVMLVLGLFGWMGIARLQRGEFLRLMGQDYVQAARALGATNSRIIFRHLLPNALGPVLVSVSFGVATAMLTEGALSFLGLGVTEPNTSWGQILNTGKEQLVNGSKNWWTFTVPGAAIFLAVTCYNLVGDGLRDATDPRLKR